MIIISLLMVVGIIYFMTKNQEEIQERVLVPVKINPEQIIKEKFLNGQIDETTYYEMISELKNNLNR